MVVVVVDAEVGVGVGIDCWVVMVGMMCCGCWGWNGIISCASKRNLSCQKKLIGCMRNSPLGCRG